MFHTIRRRTILVSLLLCTLLCVAALSSCAMLNDFLFIPAQDPEPGPEPADHEHVYDREVATEKYLQAEATCRTPATYYYSCACGEAGTEVFYHGAFGEHQYGTEYQHDGATHWHVCTVCGARDDAGPHVYDDYLINDRDGTHQYVCVCGKTTAPVSHTFDEHNAGDAFLLSPATCTEPARYAVSCVCGKLSDTASFTSGEALGHDFAENWVRDETSHYRACSRCDVCTDAGTHVFSTEWHYDGTAHFHACVCGVRKDETAHALSHHAGQAATDTDTGWEAYDTCSGCPYSTYRAIRPLTLSFVEQYNDDYGRTALAAMEKAPALLALYDAIDDAAFAFHTDATIDAPVSSAGNELFTVTNAPYKTLGLTAEDAYLVWWIYKNDHPLYYWISTWYSTSNGALHLYTDTPYASGTDRAAMTARIYDMLDGYLALLDGTESAYETVLLLHDAIVNAIEYAYETDGVTPISDPWAHSLVGAVAEKRGVCECYTRLFHVLLNRAGVDCIAVSGSAGTERDASHAWNLVRLDDGKWYWCDLTWDDQGETIYHYYCCCTDEEPLYRAAAGSVTFFLLHTPDDMIPLPARAAEPYAGKAA